LSVLERLLAEIVEGQIEPTLHVLVDRRGEADAAALCQRLEPRGHVDTVAVDAPSFDGDVTEMQTDAVEQAPLRWQRRGEVCEYALRSDRTAQRIERGGKLREHVVAGCIHHASAVLADVLGELFTRRGEGGDRRGLVLGEQPRVTRCVGREDRSEPVLHQGVP
jgi:hypothetical protein